MEKAKAERVVGVGVVPNPKARLLDQVREVIRVKHYSIRTEDAYVQWIKRFIFFHGKRHPREMGAAEIEGFLTDLAVQKKVAAATHQATTPIDRFMLASRFAVGAPSSRPAG